MDIGSIDKASGGELTGSYMQLPLMPSSKASARFPLLAKPESFPAHGQAGCDALKVIDACMQAKEAS